MSEISMISGKCLPLSSSLNKLQAIYSFHGGRRVIEKMLICCQMEKLIFVCLSKVPNQLMCTEYLLCVGDWREPLVPT